MTKKEIQLAVFVALGALFGWVWFTESGKRAAKSAGGAVASGMSTAVEAVQNLARGLRNNNPGNIRISSSAWQGKIPVSQNTDGAFEQFTDMVYGVRALGKLLLNYFQNYGLDTVQGLINRYAPPSENLTGSYVAFVSDQLGVNPTDRINVADPHVLSQLVEAIIKHENGIAQAAMVPDAVIADGVGRAFA